MSDLTSIEKLKVEKVLEMDSGYVLDFTNKQFQEFILENIDIDIYDEKYNYLSGSKANRLRGFWKKEINSVVGEILEKLLEYREVKRLINHKSISYENQTLLNEYKSIIERLKQSCPRSDDGEYLKNDNFYKDKFILLSEFDKFARFSEIEERKKRGILLEDLLKRIFSLYKIPVQKSFRRNEGGEQIDGAFKLESWYYLVECKWTEKLTDVRQLDSLSGKISRSGKQTLGLFLSINGWSKNVCPLLKKNQDKSIVLMDGYDLRSVLVEQNNIDLEGLLLHKLERLNFEGEPFYSAAQYLQNR